LIIRRRWCGRAPAHEAGYRRINGYSPYPIEELDEAIGFTRTTLPLIVLAGGILGGWVVSSMQYWIEVIKLSVERRRQAYNSWPAFIPIRLRQRCYVRRSRLSWDADVE